MANLKYINAKGEVVSDGAPDMAYQVNEDDAGADAFVQNIKDAAAAAKREGKDTPIVTVEAGAKTGALTSSPVTPAATTLSPSKGK